MKNEFLNPDEAAAAARDNWDVARVYDLATKSWSIQVLPKKALPTMPNAASAFAFVMAKAQAGDAAALKAVRAVLTTGAKKPAP